MVEVIQYITQKVIEDKHSPLRGEKKIMDQLIKQNRRLLLASGGISNEDRLTAWQNALKDFLKEGTEILFVPYAIKDYDSSVSRLREYKFFGDFNIVGIHTFNDPVKAVEDAEAVFVSGGNSFRLLSKLYETGLVEALRKHVAAGKPYMGASAGSNMSCPTMMTTNDMPIMMPPSFDSLGLIPFQINPHYMDGRVYLKKGDEYVPHSGETRDIRLNEYHEENDLPILGLREGEVLRVEGDKARLCGIRGAKLFKKGEEPVEVSEGSDVSFLFA